MLHIWYLYIVECNDGTLYTGITKDVQKRVYAHNHTSAGAKYTKARRPVKLIGFYEVGNSKGVALTEESVVKKLSHVDKRKLITSASPDISKFKPIKRKRRGKKRKKRTNPRSSRNTPRARRKNN